MIERARTRIATFAAIAIGGSLVLGSANAALASSTKPGHHSSAAAATVSPVTLPSLAGSSGSTSTHLIAGLDTPAANESTAIQELGRTPALMNGFYDFVDAAGAPQAFPRQWVQQILSMGSTPMITWRPNLLTASTTSVLTSISRGDQDAYITQWAEQAKAVNHRIYVRLMHEFNGNWYPWGSVVAGTTPIPGGTGTYPYTNTGAMYVAAFRHVVDIFRQVGATNVDFVWCAASGAPTSQLSSWYPGDSYVTWASLDGYNKESTAPRSFDDVFKRGYKDITAVTSRPVYIAETASVEFNDPAVTPSTKAAWITDGYLSTVPKLFPHVIGVSYFDGPGAGYTYPFDSSQSALQAIKQVFASPEYQASAS